jgi:hypothetical protein
MVLATLPILPCAASSTPQHTTDRTATAATAAGSSGPVWRAGFDAAADTTGSGSKSKRSSAGGGGLLAGGPVGGTPAMSDEEKHRSAKAGRQKRGAPAEANAGDEVPDAPRPAKRQQVRQAGAGANGEEVVFGVGPWTIDLDVSRSLISPVTSD